MKEEMVYNLPGNRLVLKQRSPLYLAKEEF
jgi:hypothetical protein